MTATRGIPLEGDRGAFDVIDHPDMHALDLKNGVPVYHWTQSQLDDLFLMLDGSNQALWIPNPTGDETQDLSGSLNIIGGGTGDIYTHYLQQEGEHVISLGDATSNSDVIIGKDANLYLTSWASVIAGQEAGLNARSLNTVMIGRYAGGADTNVPLYTNRDVSVIAGEGAAWEATYICYGVIMGSDAGEEANVEGAVLIGSGAGGYSGLNANDTIWGIVSIGPWAGYAAEGESDIYIGDEAGSGANFWVSGAPVGEYSIGIGIGAFDSGAGYYNITMGPWAGEDIIGDSNIAFGYMALDGAEGDYNIGIGEGALGYNWLKSSYVYSKTIAIGAYAGNRASSSSSLFLGNEAGYDEQHDERLHVHNERTNASLIYGEFDNRLLRAFGDIDALDPNVLAEEVLSETDFATHANWSTTGDFNDTGGNAAYTHATGSGTLTQASGGFTAPAVDSAWYAFTYTVVSINYTLRTLYITDSFAEHAVDLKPYPVAAGTFTVYFKAAASPGDFVISATSTTGGACVIDNVSLQRIEGGGTVRGHGGLITKVSTDSASDPPTYSEIAGMFGHPLVLGPGFIGVVDVGGLGQKSYIAWTTQYDWWVSEGTLLAGPSPSASASESASLSPSSSASASVSSSVSSSVSPSPSPPMTPNGLLNNLVAYWPGNEASGNLLDAHTNNITLTDVGTVTSAGGNVYDTARQYTAANNERHRISDSALLSMGINTVDFTLAAWVYMDSKAAALHIIMAKASDLTSVSGREYGLFYAGGATDRFMFLAGNGSSTGQVAADALGSPSTGQWYFVVGWFDSVADTVNIQVNGGAVNSASYAAGARDYTGGLGIGSDYASTTYDWNGRIGPVAIWKSAAAAGGVLTTTQRTALYAGGSGLRYGRLTDDYPSGSASKSPSSSQSPSSSESVSQSASPSPSSSESVSASASPSPSSSISPSSSSSASASASSSSSESASLSPSSSESASGSASQSQSASESASGSASGSSSESPSPSPSEGA